MQVSRLRLEKTKLVLIHAVKFKEKANLCHVNVIMVLCEGYAEMCSLFTCVDV